MIRARNEKIEEAKEVAEDKDEQIKRIKDNLRAAKVNLEQEQTNEDFRLFGSLLGMIKREFCLSIDRRRHFADSSLHDEWSQHLYGNHRGRSSHL